MLSGSRMIRFSIRLPFWNDKGWSPGPIPGLRNTGLSFGRVVYEVVKDFFLGADNQTDLERDCERKKGCEGSERGIQVFAHMPQFGATLH